MSDMFCFQCQQTAGNKCCVSVGVCGKQPDTAALQDELVYELIRLAEAAAAAGQRTQIVDRLLMDGLFITLTNVNFDNQAIAEFTERVRAEREKFGGKPCAVVELWKGDTDTVSLRSTLLFGMNVVVVLTFAFLFKKYDSCMYTMIEMFISSKAVNLVLYGPGVSEVCYIITNNVNAIKSAITCTMGRGVTLLRGEGAWSGKEMQVILCVVKRPEIAQLREVVRSVDEHAFVIVSEAKEVFGRGFGNIYGDD